MPKYDKDPTTTSGFVYENDHIANNEELAEIFAHHFLRAIREAGKEAMLKDAVILDIGGGEGRISAYI